jgi:hypothetical protein
VRRLRRARNATKGKVARHRANFPDTLPAWENSQQEAKVMTKILDELLAANVKYAENFGGQRQPAAASEPLFCDPHLYGCPP